MAGRSRSSTTSRQKRRVRDRSRREATINPRLRARAPGRRASEEDDEIARAFAHVEASPHIYLALSFFAEWPRLDLAAKLILANAGRWDGRHYGALGNVASMLDDEHPLSASILYRAVLNDILSRGRSQAYGHGARYLAKLEALAANILDWSTLDDHTAYALGVRKAHGRKYGFWNLAEAKPKR